MAKLTTYIPKRFLPWLPTLSSSEAKVYINLCSWTDKGDHQGKVYMDTLASGRKGSEEKGCDMPERSVRRILRRLKGKGLLNLHSGKGRQHKDDQENKKGITYMLQDATSEKLVAAGGPAPLGRGAAAPLENSNSRGTDQCTLWHSLVQSEAPGVQSQDPTSANNWHSMTDAEESLDLPDPGPGCVAIPHALVRSDISGNALKLYCILKSWGPKGKLKWSALSRATGIGRNNVRTAALELECMRWIKLNDKTYEIPDAINQKDKEYAAAVARANEEAKKREEKKMNKPVAPTPAPPKDPKFDALLGEITDSPKCLSGTAPTQGRPEVAPPPLPTQEKSFSKFKEVLAKRRANKD